MAYDGYNAKVSTELSSITTQVKTDTQRDTKYMFLRDTLCSPLITATFRFRHCVPLIID